MLACSISHETSSGQFQDTCRSRILQRSAQRAKLQRISFHQMSKFGKGFISGIWARKASSFLLSSINIIIKTNRNVSLAQKILDFPTGRAALPSWREAYKRDAGPPASAWTRAQRTLSQVARTSKTPYLCCTNLGQRLIVGAADGDLHVWPSLSGLLSRRPPETRSAHFPRMITSVCAWPEKGLVVSGGDDHTVALWDVDTMLEVKLGVAAVRISLLALLTRYRGTPSRHRAGGTTCEVICGAACSCDYQCCGGDAYRGARRRGV